MSEAVADVGVVVPHLRAMLLAVGAMTEAERLSDGDVIARAALYLVGRPEYQARLAVAA